MKEKLLFLRVSLQHQAYSHNYCKICCNEFNFREKERVFSLKHICPWQLITEVSIKFGHHGPHVSNTQSCPIVNKSWSNVQFLKSTCLAVYPVVFCTKRVPQVKIEKVTEVYHLKCEHFFVRHDKTLTSGPQMARDGINRDIFLTSISLQSLNRGLTLQYATRILLFRDIRLLGKIEGHTREVVEYSSMLITSTTPAWLKNGPQYPKPLFNNYGWKYSVRNLNLFFSVQYAPIDFLKSETFVDSLLHGLKGQLWNRPDLDTTFCQLEKRVSQNPSDTSRNPLQSCLMFHSNHNLLLKTFLCAFFSWPYYIF